MTAHSHITSMKEGIASGPAGNVCSGTDARRMKAVSDKEAITAQISRLGDYSAIHYVSEGWPGPFLIIVEINQDYPKKGKKYTISFDDLTDGCPAGNKLFIAQSNRPAQIARWLLGRKATLYSRQP